MGETRVDLLHLLEDLRDAYVGPAEETILTEIVANSLDSGATLIAATTDPILRTFTLVDNGGGMRRRGARASASPVSGSRWRSCSAARC